MSADSFVATAAFQELLLALDLVHGDIVHRDSACKTMAVQVLSPESRQRIKQLMEKFYPWVPEDICDGLDVFGLRLELVNNNLIQNEEALKPLQAFGAALTQFERAEADESLRIPSQLIERVKQAGQALEAAVKRILVSLTPSSVQSLLAAMDFVVVSRIAIGLTALLQSSQLRSSPLTAVAAREQRQGLQLVETLQRFCSRKRERDGSEAQRHVPISASEIKSGTPPAPSVPVAPASSSASTLQRAANGDAAGKADPSPRKTVAATPFREHIRGVVQTPLRTQMPVFDSQKELQASGVDDDDDTDSVSTQDVDDDREAVLRGADVVKHTVVDSVVPGGIGRVTTVTAPAAVVGSSSPRGRQISNLNMSSASLDASGIHNCSAALTSSVLDTSDVPEHERITTSQKVRGRNLLPDDSTSSLSRPRQQRVPVSRTYILCDTVGGFIPAAIAGFFD